MGDWRTLKKLLDSMIDNDLEADMTIRVRGSSFQVDFVHAGKRYRKNHRTREKAEAWEIKSKARLLEGLPLDPNKPIEPQTIGKKLEDLLWDVYDMTWSEQKSYHTTRNRLKKVLRELDGSMEINDLTTDVLDQYVVTLERQGNRPGTINRKLSVLSKALRHAYRREDLKRMPHVPRQGEPPTRFRWYTEGEQKIILEACRESNYPDFFLLMMTLFDTGMRISEVMFLKRSSVMLDKRVFVLGREETKNDLGRAIPMTDRMNRLYSQRSVGSSNFYFDMSYDTICKEWHQVRNRIGMGQGDTIHAIRHTFCSRLSQNGVDMRRIQEFAGHKDLSTTQRYTHLDVEKTRDDINKLESCTDLNHLLPCDSQRDTDGDSTSS